MRLLWKCAVVVTASTVQSLGLTLQRLSHLEPPLIPGPRSGSTTPINRPSSPFTSNDNEVPANWNHADGRPNDTANEEEITNKHSLMLWRLGIALFIFANLFGSTVQLAVLPLVLVCTLQAVGLVANSVLAHLILKEALTRNAIIGTVLVICGAVLVAGLGGNQSDPEVSLDGLFKLLGSTRFAMWMSVTVLLALGMAFYARKLALIKLLTTNSRQSMNTNSISAANNINTRANIARIDTTRGWLWGCAGGIASAHSLLMAKLMIGLLVHDFPDILGNFLKVRFWTIALLFLTFALSQMWSVNCGLQCTSTSVLYPLVFCVYNLTTLTNSAMLYGADNVFGEGHEVWLVLGTIILIAGVLNLSTRFDDGSYNDPSTSILPQWQPHHSASRITMGTLATPSPHARSPSLLCSAPNSPLMTGSSAAPPLSPMEESSSLLNGPSYTSFDSISPNITNPDKIRGRPGHRVLSKEQHKILRELGV